MLKSNSQNCNHFNSFPFPPGMPWDLFYGGGGANTAPKCEEISPNAKAPRFCYSHSLHLQPRDFLIHRPIYRGPTMCQDVPGLEYNYPQALLSPQRNSCLKEGIPMLFLDSALDPGFQPSSHLLLTGLFSYNLLLLGFGAG